MVGWLRRTLPGRPLEPVGDGSYAVIALGLRCRQQAVTLIALTTKRFTVQYHEAGCPAAKVELLYVRVAR